MLRESRRRGEETLKDAADAHRFLLAHGILAIADVAAWADAEIAQAADPPAALLDASLHAGRGEAGLGETLAALGAVPGEVGIAPVSGIALRLLARRLADDPDALGAVVSAIEHLALDGLVPDPDRLWEMQRLDDAFALAASGAYGTLAEVRADVWALLRDFAEPDPAAE